jgi:CAAX prenyl protease-like protein
MRQMQPAKVCLARSNPSGAVSCRASFVMSPIIARSLPFGLYIAILALEGLLPDWVPGFDVRWLYPVKAGLVALALTVLWRKYTELESYNLPFRQFLLSLVVGVVVFVLWINMDEGWMLVGSVGEGYNPTNETGQIDWLLVSFRIVGAALVVPIMEELFWRSFLQRWLQTSDFLSLDPAKVGLKALFIASALFAVEHFQWLAGLIAGLAYGWLYIRTRNLWSPIIAHAVTNGVLGIYVVNTGYWRFW